tara:strand:+ start:266 stop:424 length:159 start_codon:yes stop_codon:yes gene_type:complete
VELLVLAEVLDLLAETPVMELVKVEQVELEELEDKAEQAELAVHLVTLAETV